MIVEKLLLRALCTQSIDSSIIASLISLYIIFVKLLVKLNAFSEIKKFKNRNFKTKMNSNQKDEQFLKHLEDRQIGPKQVFYAKRVRDTVDGNYFVISRKPVICNGSDLQKFCLKIGGLIYARKKKIPGKRISSCAERFKELDTFGSYVYYCSTDLKLRCVTYVRKTGFPDNKVVSGIGVLNNVIPRFDGRNQNLITIMRIDTYMTADRRWTKFDGKANDGNLGYHELNVDFDFGPVIGILNLFRRRYFGIYVTENTSLLMIDETRHNVFNDLIRNRVYTLFQSGAFIFVELSMYYKFYYLEESESFEPYQMSEKRELMPKTRNFENIRFANIILFLKPAEDNAFWTLRCVRENDFIDQRHVVLGIPSGGQFEDVLDWDEGIDEVYRRQAIKPWNKYVKLLGEKNSAFIVREINLNLNESYP
jgi:hypothetical protein